MPCAQAAFTRCVVAFADADLDRLRATVSRSESPVVDALAHLRAEWLPAALEEAARLVLGYLL